jgi:hypothetical protein
VPGPSKERDENRKTPGDYILEREDVEIWAKEGLDEMLKGFVPEDVCFFFVSYMIKSRG